MKPYTRHVLDLCTGQLVSMGLRKVRRGLAVESLNDQMLGAVALQHREWADGYLWIDTYPQVYWEPVERIYCIGTAQKFSVTRLPTRSRMWSFGSVGLPKLEFHPDEDATENLGVLAKFIDWQVLPKIRELAAEDSIEAFYREEVLFGGARPERFMAIKAWQKRTVLLDEEFEWVCSVLKDRAFMDSVTEFYRRLKMSDELQSYLTLRAANA